MSNCHVRELIKVYACIFADASSAFPAMRGEFEKDLARLNRLVVQRGIHTYVVDLPAVGKHLDKCLAGGQYKLSGLPLTKRFSGRVVIPKFLRGLYLLVFHETGHLREDYNVEAIIFLRQILFGAKKATLNCSEEAVNREINEFLELDASLPEVSDFWSSDKATKDDVVKEFTGFSKSPHFTSRVTQDSTPEGVEERVLLMNLDMTSSIIATTLGRFDHRDWSFRHGPGAISERTGPFNKYSLLNWPDRLENAFPLADCGYHNYASWAAGTISQEKTSYEVPSRLIDVPKTYTKPRLIAAEPSEHQWCQQNLWHYFCSRVESTMLGGFVRFRDQTLNQVLCKRGSSDGSLATVDLSSASDRVTCETVGQMFRSNPGLVLSLQSSRTRFVKQTQLFNWPVVNELRKFSTMGSACTFPVQSMVFLAVALASVLTKRHVRVTPENIRRLLGEVAVFGDDIIVPVDCRALFVRCLEILHFKVNTDKSHWTGRFRESCGVDAFDGVDVTPVYWRSPNRGTPDSIASTIEVSNNFYRKWFLTTSSYLASTVPRLIPLVSVESGVCGLKSFVAPLPSHYRVRWNGQLHRMESLVLGFRSRVQKTPITDDSALLQFFTEAPQPTTYWQGGVAQRPRLYLKSGWVPLFDVTNQ